MSKLLLPFALMYAGYAAMMVTKVGVEVALPASPLESDEGGILLAIGAAGCVVGGLVSGYLVGQVGGRPIFVGCLMANALMMLLMIESEGTWLLLLFGAYFVVRIGHAALWPAMAILAKSYCREEDRGFFQFAWGVLTTSSRIGASFAALSCGAVLHEYDNHWTAPLFFSAGVAFLISFLIHFALKKPNEADDVVIIDLAEDGLLTSMASLDDADEADEGAKKKKKGAKQLPTRVRKIRNLIDERAKSPEERLAGGDVKYEQVLNESDREVLSGAAAALSTPLKEESLREMLLSSQFLVLVVAMACVTPLMELQSVVPLMLVQLGGMQAGEAGKWTSVFPFTQAVSIVGASALIRRHNGIERYLYAVCLILCAVAAAVLHWHAKGPMMVLACLTVMGAGSAPPFFLPIAPACVEIGGEKNGAFLFAMMDVVGFFVSGCVFAMGLSWDQLLKTYGVLGLIGAVVFFSVQKRKKRKRVQERNRYRAE